MNKSCLWICRPVAICPKTEKLTFNLKNSAQNSWCLVKKKRRHVLSAACFPFAHQADGRERLFRNEKGCWLVAVEAPALYVHLSSSETPQC